MLNVNCTSDTIPSCKTKISGYFFICISFNTVSWSIVKKMKGYTKTITTTSKRKSVWIKKKINCTLNVTRTTNWAREDVLQRFRWQELEQTLTNLRILNKNILIQNIVFQTKNRLLVAIIMPGIKYQRNVEKAASIVCRFSPYPVLPKPGGFSPHKSNYT